jgi:hypothetical protein
MRRRLFVVCALGAEDRSTAANRVYAICHAIVTNP